MKSTALAALAALAAVSAAPARVLAAEPAPAQAPAGEQDYRIGTYDTIDIEVFEISDLNRQVQVDGAGRVRLPLVGEVQAEGRTTVQLSDDLKQKLEARYLNQARVSVRVTKSQSQQVTVDGAVTAPGVYPLTGRTTLLQAVAMAKGPDGANANVHKVTLFHSVDAKWMSTQYDLAKIRSGAVGDPVIQGRDVVLVAGSKSHSVLTTLGAVLPVVLLMGAL